MSKKSEEGRVALSLRLTTGMHKKLAEEAEKNHRSVNMQIIHLIAKAGFVVVMFISSGCAFDQTIEYRIAPDLQKHVDQFYQEAQSRGIDLKHKNLIVEWGSIWDDGRMGHSHKKGSQRIVTIDISFKAETETHKEVIIFHELGHALLGLNHTTGIMSEHPGFTIYEKLDSGKVIVESAMREVYISQMMMH